MKREQPILTNGTMLQDRYEVLGVLGKGGFSIVYKVKDLQNEGQVFALKAVTHPNKQERKRSTIESEILKQLDHPALPHVYDVFDDDEEQRACLVMTYVEGTNLEKLRRQQPEQRFSQAQVLRIMAPILDAVAYLHEHEPPVIHRDIKPANIIVEDEEQGAALVDFGIAKAYESDGTTTATRYCTPGFSAPEQYTDGTEARSDIYGLAATFYLLLTGVVPNDALERLVRINEKGSDPLAPINAIVPEIDAALCEAIQHALSLSKHDRFPGVDQFRQALRNDAAIEQVHWASLKPLVSLVPALSSRRKTNFQPTRLTIGALLAAAVLCCFIGTGFFFSASLFPGLHSTTPKTAVSPQTGSSQGTNGAGQAPSTTTSDRGATLYSAIAGPYNGTVHNIAANLTTVMILTVQQQSQGKIRGSFIGLQVKGSFSGTIDATRHIHFTVASNDGHALLTFDGIMHASGDLAGSFCSPDQSGQCSGYGVWSVIRS